jgi:hypothetical protein
MKGMGWTSFPAMGIGPLDSLMNAVTLIRGFHDHVGGMHISYATSKGSRPRSGKAKRA